MRSKRVRAALSPLILVGGLAACKIRNNQDSAKDIVTVDRSTGSQLDAQCNTTEQTVKGIQARLQLMGVWLPDDSSAMIQAMQSIVGAVGDTKQLIDQLRNSMRVLLRDISSANPDNPGELVARVDRSTLDRQVTCPLISLVGGNPDVPVDPALPNHGWGSDRYRPSCPEFQESRDPILEQVMIQLASLDDKIVRILAANRLENQTAQLQFQNDKNGVILLLGQVTAQTNMILSEVRSWQYAPIAAPSACGVLHGARAGSCWVRNNPQQRIAVAFSVFDRGSQCILSSAPHWSEAVLAIAPGQGTAVPPPTFGNKDITVKVRGQSQWDAHGYNYAGNFFFDCGP